MGSIGRRSVASLTLGLLLSGCGALGDCSVKCGEQDVYVFVSDLPGPWRSAGHITLCADTSCTTSTPGPNPVVKTPLGGASPQVISLVIEYRGSLVMRARTTER